MSPRYAPLLLLHIFQPHQYAAVLPPPAYTARYHALKTYTLNNCLYSRRLLRRSPCAPRLHASPAHTPRSFSAPPFHEIVLSWITFSFIIFANNFLCQNTRANIPIPMKKTKPNKIPPPAFVSYITSAFSCALTSV